MDCQDQGQNEPIISKCLRIHLTNMKAFLQDCADF